MPLTRVAVFKGVPFVSNEKMRGRKYGVERIGADGRAEIHVSPAVWDLLKTDFNLVKKKLPIKGWRIAKGKS